MKSPQLMFFLALTVSITSLAQQLANTQQLPTPSGRYGVSRITYFWTDHSRVDALSNVAGAPRELVVYVWYPRDRDEKGTMAPYLPGSNEVANSPSAKQMEKFWGNLWPNVLHARIRSNTLDKVPIAPGKKPFPLLIFSPGLGTPSTSYTSLIEAVVSRGYVVASIEPSYEVPAVVFSDGRVRPFKPEATGRGLPGPPGETRDEFLKRMHVFDAPHLDRWAADIRFALDQIAALSKASDHTCPFAGRVDLNHVGTWGHSFGGQAALRACQLDSRFKACLNADGLGPDGPVFRYEGGKLPEQPFMWMEVFHQPPTDAQLAPYKMTTKDWEQNHLVQLEKNREELQGSPNGSFHVVIDLPGIQHSSFTDKPFLDASTTEETKDAAAALRTVANCTLAYFDSMLRNRTKRLRDLKRAQHIGITLEVFENHDKRHTDSRVSTH